MIVNKHKKIFW